jgi:hypothetical protein
MSEILVAPWNDRWAAFINGKPVVKSPCKACIVKALSIFYANNTNYTTIVVRNETGQLMETIQIGAAVGR